MHLRILPLLCVLGLPALAQNKPTDKSATAGPQQQNAVPKGRPQPMEHHSRSTWHYHSGPKRNTLPGGDSSSAKPASSQDQNGDNGGR